MKNQSRTIKTNLELDRVVMGGSGGYRRLPGGSDDFSLQTELHHNIYIINEVMPQNEIDKYSEHFALGSRRPVLYNA